jgi:hypothetical protein
MSTHTFTKRRFEQITVKEVYEGSLSTTDSTGFGIPSYVASVIKPGDVLQLELYKFNEIGGLMKPNGEYLFHRSDEYFTRQHEEWLAEHKKKQEDHYEANKDDWQKRTEDLPDRYRARLERFINDPEKGEEFRKEGMGWGYELIVCELACLYEEHGFGGGSFDTEPEPVRAFALDHGTSGNQHAVAKSWASNPEAAL